MPPIKIGGISLWAKVLVGVPCWDSAHLWAALSSCWDDFPCRSFSSLPLSSQGCAAWAHYSQARKGPLGSEESFSQALDPPGALGHSPLQFKAPHIQSRVQGTCHRPHRPRRWQGIRTQGPGCRAHADALNSLVGLRKQATCLQMSLVIQVSESPGLGLLHHMPNILRCWSLPLGSLLEWMVWKERGSPGGSSAAPAGALEPFPPSHPTVTHWTPLIPHGSWAHETAGQGGH